jgi:hypothetical protein
MNNKSTYQYQNISSFGPEVRTLAVNNPLSYCLSNGMDNSFMHGGYAGKMLNRQSEPCQNYISEYCAKNWDEYCELESRNQFKMSNAVNTQQNTLNNAVVGLTAGEVLIYNTAMKKYVLHREGNCKLVTKQFDPTVASSPMYSEWSSGEGYCSTGNCDDQSNAGGACVPVYGVDPVTINSDPLMHKILDKPIIALDILRKIYVDMKREGTLNQLVGSRLGEFFQKNFN